MGILYSCCQCWRQRVLRRKACCQADWVHNLWLAIIESLICIPASNAFRRHNFWFSFKFRWFTVYCSWIYFGLTLMDSRTLSKIRYAMWKSPNVTFPINLFSRDCQFGKGCVGSLSISIIYEMTDLHKFYPYNSRMKNHFLYSFRSQLLVSLPLESAVIWNPKMSTFSLLWTRKCV